jgi:hypothetical protein
MPDQEIPEDGALEAEEYDIEPSAQEQFMADLTEAFQPSEEDYGPFDPTDIITPPADENTFDEARSDAPTVPGFDPRYRDEFEGLLYIGSLRKRFQWMGHLFVIRTLTVNETLEVGLINKPYVGTLAEMKAYQAATVAASVVTVDGKALPVPVSLDLTDLEARFEYVINHWQPITIDMLYGQIMELEAKVTEVLAALGKARG